MWSDDHGAALGLFANRWLWAALALSLGLQIAVVYVPVLQAAFSTVSLNPRDWLVCAAMASSVLWLMEPGKLLGRARR